MDAAADLSAVLQDVLGDLAPAGALAQTLTRLVGAVTLSVPSCSSVTLALADVGGEVDVSSKGLGVRALASLALPLTGLPGGDVLVLRADTSGAFLLLALDLTERVGADAAPVLVDKHLVPWPALSRAELVARVSDARDIDQAVGALLDRGLPPDAARAELHRRAGTSDAEQGRLLLRAL